MRYLFRWLLHASQCAAKHRCSMKQERRCVSRALLYRRNSRRKDNLAVLAAVLRWGSLQHHATLPNVCLGILYNRPNYVVFTAYPSLRRCVGGSSLARRFLKTTISWSICTTICETYLVRQNTIRISVGT